MEKRSGKVKEVLEKGMIINVEVTQGDDGLRFSLFQVPKVQGAVVAVDPKSNQVLALVGGALSSIHTSTVPFRVNDSQGQPSSLSYMQQALGMDLLQALCSLTRRSLWMQETTQFIGNQEIMTVNI